MTIFSRFLYFSEFFFDHVTISVRHVLFIWHEFTILSDTLSTASKFAFDTQGQQRQNYRKGAECMFE